MFVRASLVLCGIRECWHLPEPHRQLWFFLSRTVLTMQERLLSDALLHKPHFYFGPISSHSPAFSRSPRPSRHQAKVSLSRSASPHFTQAGARGLLTGFLDTPWCFQDLLMKLSWRFYSSYCWVTTHCVHMMHLVYSFVSWQTFEWLPLLALTNSAPINDHKYSETKTPPWINKTYNKEQVEKGAEKHRRQSSNFLCRPENLIGAKYKIICGFEVRTNRLSWGKKGKESTGK